jgi:hypothetical protein
VTRVKRFCCAVLVLLGLTAPILARGDDTLQPVPANGQCSVPGDPQWTPQEIFVWQHVCVGEVADLADFNKGRNYGGNLDPKRPEGWPESRIISLAFLKTIFLDDKYRKVPRQRQIRIVGAHLTDTLNLENIQLEDEFDLVNSLLEKGVNFSGLRSAYAVSLVGSNVTGPFVMNEGHLGGQLSLEWSKIGEQPTDQAGAVAEAPLLDGTHFHVCEFGFDLHTVSRLERIDLEIEALTVEICRR